MEQIEKQVNRQMDKGALAQGVSAGIPIMIGYLPIGVAFGVISRETGVPLLDTVLMSSLVFAGASQFMAINMIAMGASFAEIVLATFVLNFRHFVMSMSLMNRVREVPRSWKAALSLGITDETFAVASLQKEKPHQLFLGGLMLAAYVSWVFATLLGALLSNVIPPEIGASMSIALYAMFIGLLVPAIRQYWKVGLIAALSAGLCTLFSSILSGGWAIVLATLLGGLAGILVIDVEDDEE
ncbi:autotransporter [Caldalkalibacillus thermarum]|uniref:AzlC family ABC transporter permease n=1 Tax=Caldalkalibacillus thermarum TaxID=296745 RepID=UPI00166B0F3B|nr:AzlC family ABC transporter permease [Caldalkalibacillus thermarum]GGK16706.1 autotransporter [Caldalkalibacillus thermarum]GGK26364.1 autotransporter [Caldalkalibacillus thermarum]